MNPIYNFKGHVALVTGAAKGMGLATARMFADPDPPLGIDGPGLVTRTGYGRRA
jgi:hypothetical protein